MKAKSILSVLMSGFVLGFGARALASHHEAPKPKTRNGIEFVSGGVGDEQQKAMRRMANDYALQLVVTRPDGRYLARGDVQISKDSGEGLLALESKGPLVYADLEPGRYMVEVTEGGHTVKRAVNVEAEGNTSLVVAIAESA